MAPSWATTTCSTSPPRWACCSSSTSRPPSSSSTRIPAAPRWAPVSALPGRLEEYRSVLGGLLAQGADLADLDPAALKVVTKRQPTPAERHALRFAWRVGKHAKSNAIVLTTVDQVVGVGAGQMNRVDSARLAVMRAREVGLPTEGTVCASDAFFPFRDGLDVVAKAGVTAVIQPGGSVRDEDVIAAADEHGMAMLFTGLRHFRHGGGRDRA